MPQMMFGFMSAKSKTRSEVTKFSSQEDPKLTSEVFRSKTDRPDPNRSGPAQTLFLRREGFCGRPPKRPVCGVPSSLQQSSAVLCCKPNALRYGPFVPRSFHLKPPDPNGVIYYKLYLKFPSADYNLAFRYHIISDALRSYAQNRSPSNFNPS